jgi:hypothetical protein
VSVLVLVLPVSVLALVLVLPVSVLVLVLPVSVSVLVLLALVLPVCQVYHPAEIPAASLVFRPA